MINEKYSFKDFSNQTFLDADPAEFTGVIKGSCFNQDEYREIFPDIAGVTFERCNLDNVAVPLMNNIFSDCCNRRQAIQNDKMLWIVDEQGTPLEPSDIKAFNLLGVPIDPKYISKEPLDFSVLEIVEGIHGAFS